MSDGSAAPPEHGSTELLLGRLGQRYAALARLGVGVASALVAPWSQPAVGAGPTAVVAVVFIGWSVVYAVRMLRGPVSWWSGADVVVVMSLCLAVPQLGNPQLIADFSGWIVNIASIVVISVHWHLRPVAAWVATLLIAVAYITGAAMVPDTSAFVGLKGGLWMVVEGGLSMLVWALVRRGGRAADVVMAGQFAARRESDLAAARRADQRTHWAAVHDTSATTLLMVGTGEIRGDEPWLAAQLRRDIGALDGAQPPDREPVDVLGSLTAALDGVPAAPAIEHRGRAVAPARVAAAIVGATIEAIENVRRHSGGAAARVRFEALPDRILVTIADTGGGFDPAAPATGRGLRWSVTDRMSDVGGTARVRSAPGAGTTVSLEWPRG